MADPNTRQGKRTPVTLKIKFKSETLEQFIERYAVDVSQGGIFIRTKEPLAVGTQMRFEFQLRDASPLIAGEGTVVWTRENDPSRPAIAPGMGVRFDRLADGSQSVLERILAEKAKQQPQRQQPETTRPPLFTDTPTRVAPAPVQEALLGDRAFSDQQTPLPKPMPFHSDADEFPEEAFEEATKVRALDELIAQSAAAEPATIHSRRDDLIAKTAERTKEQEAVAPLPEPAERESAPVLPSPPEAPRTATGDRAAAAAAAAVSTPALASGGEAGRTRLGLEPARVETAPRVSAQMPASATSSSGSIPSTPVLTPKDKAKEAEREKTAAREKSATAKEAPRPTAPATKSAAPMVILILLLLGAGGAAVWFFVLREKVADQVAETPKVTVDASTVAAGPDAASMAVIADAGSAGAVVDNGSGGTIVEAGSGSGSAGSASVPPGVATVDTVITASAKGATVSVAGLSGPAPFTAKLEKDKEYQAQITAVGHLPLTVTVKGGGPRVTAKLTPKPYVITVNSTPPGALVYVDGRATGHSTPYDVTLEKAQAAKKSVKITLQKAGFRVGSSVVPQTVYSEGAEMMTTTVDVTLAAAPVRQPPPDRPDPPDDDPDEGSAGSAVKPPDTGSATKPPDTGSATKPPDTGSATKPPAGSGSGSGSATKPAGSGSASGSATKPTGSGTGSAKEPEPGFMNRE